MKKLIKYGWILASVALLGCHKFLEPVSQSEFVPKLVQSLQEMLLGEVYMGPGGVDVDMFGMMSAFDDDLTIYPFAGKIVSESESKYQRTKLAYTWSREMENSISSYDIYTAIYRKIVGCNATLDYIDDAKGTDSQKNYVKAQALTMRSFFYWYLVNLYGMPYNYDRNMPGVPLKTDSELSSGGLARNTVGEVYDKIVADLLTAESLFSGLPAQNRWSKNNMASQPLAQLLLSRIYLYMENWSESLKWAEKVTGKDWNFQIFDLNSIKPIGQIGIIDLLTWNNPEVIFLHGNRFEYINFMLTDVYLTVSGRSQKRYVYSASPELESCYDNTDLRRERYLIRGTRNGYSGAPIATSKITVGSRGAISYSADNNEWGIAFKITEAYLNGAEAAAMLAKQGGSAQYLTTASRMIETIRSKRFAADDYTVENFTDADQALKFIRNERRRELCFEMHRWFDLRRYGMEPLEHSVPDDISGASVKHSLAKNDPRFVLRIPKSVMQMNNKLTQNE